MITTIRFMLVCRPITLLAAVVNCALASSAAAAVTGTDSLEQVRAAEAARIETMAKVAPSVVCVFKSDRSGGGAGVVITEDGYGLTNYHVVAPLLKTRKGLGGMSDGRLYPLEVLGIDPTGDVAMFRLTGKDRFVAAPLGDSDSVQLGDWVFAMGNPFGLSEDYTPSVTHGIVSGLHRYQFGAGPARLVYTDCIQVDASINPGNSGGPLFDMDGRIIGINGRASFEFEQRGRVNVGVGFAVSINQIKRFIPHLRAGLLAEHGALGATVADLGYRHVAVEKMLDPSAAAMAGLRIGDRLRRFAERDIHSSNLFANILGTFPAGWPVSVDFERDGRRFHERLRLDPLPVRLEEPFEPDMSVNRAEAKRILHQSQQALGTLPVKGALLFEGIYTEIRDEGIALKGDVQSIQITEDMEGRGRCEVFDWQSQPVRTIEYDRQTAELRLNDGKTVSASYMDTERFCLWALGRQAIYTPLSDEHLGRFRHDGADAVGDNVGDVLRYDVPGDGEILITFDPETQRPARIRRRLTAVPVAERPPVEIEINDWRAVQGTMLPHEIHVFVGSQLKSIESFSIIRLQEEQP